MNNNKENSKYFSITDIIKTAIERYFKINQKLQPEKEGFQRNLFISY